MKTKISKATDHWNKDRARAKAEAGAYCHERGLGGQLEDND